MIYIHIFIMEHSQHGARQQYRTQPDLDRGGTCEEGSVSLLMDGVASSGMRHWKCPCNLLRQPAALQQRHQYFRLMGRLEIYELLLSLTHNGIYTIIFFLLLQKKLHGTSLTQTPEGRNRRKRKKENMSSQAKKKIQTLIFHSQKIPTSLQLVRVQNTPTLRVFMSVCVCMRKRERKCLCVCVCEHNQQTSL